MVFIFAQLALLRKLPLSDPQLLYERPGRGWMGPSFPFMIVLWLISVCGPSFMTLSITPPSQTPNSALRHMTFEEFAPVI